MANDSGVVVVGGGIAGSEAAWQIARRGIRVQLVEMRPHVMTPAHTTSGLAELVCSNSLGSDSFRNASGVLKEELRIYGSLIMRCAEAARIPAGSALAVERDRFSRLVGLYIERSPSIRLVREEVAEIPRHRPCIIAGGPLTSPGLAGPIAQLTGEDNLYFYDAVAPIVTLESLDMSRIFWGSRYGRGGDDYLNCPMTEDEYNRFYDALVSAETAPLREFEDMRVFEACMPVETLAKRGRESLAYGPLRPVGLRDPRTGERPYAVVQLRPENIGRSLLNLVGFQTRLTWNEQRRVFRMIPGLERAEFARYGVMHRNTFINSPRILLPTLQCRHDEGLLFAGQITGVEGYLESAASGLVAGINAARLVLGLSPLPFPRETVIGALCHYVSTLQPGIFQPMNANFGILPKSDKKRHRKADRLAIAALSVEIAQHFEKTLGCRLEQKL
ncbi:MAG: methylenetetrahydrofolate--tRNA-(uracil(54)-C(5))-methyltransferase (FADH(2)-oxidizing) TrmFO [Firmicutes bacterium]|nr:methylenetetrahydrofolate--tRNA-(uracil(54)-C(5))-methyltransferase (FADH(2)-oxidizing) TrmFO [Bacillota bacterium]